MRIRRKNFFATRDGSFVLVVFRAFSFFLHHAARKMMMLSFSLSDI